MTALGSNRELQEEISALSMKLGVEVSTERLGKTSLTALRDELRARLDARDSASESASTGSNDNAASPTPPPPINGDVSTNVLGEVLPLEPRAPRPQPNITEPVNGDVSAQVGGPPG